MSVAYDELLTAFGEVILLLDRSRHVVESYGDIHSAFGCSPTEIIGTSWSDVIQQAAPPAIDALYWAVEAIFENYISPKYLPTVLPFRTESISELRVLDPDHLAVRIHASVARRLGKLIGDDIRLALTSTVGFTDVLLKNIGGPLNEIQEQDLKVIHNNAHFAQTLLEDWRRNWIVPRITAPVPVPAQQLLGLGTDDLPRRRMSSHGLELRYNVTRAAMLYSNGAIREALINLIKVLPLYVQKQSQIGINMKIEDELAEVHVTYRAAENGMKAIQRINPADMYERRQHKNSSRLKNIISSLHAQLTPYGCTAWALPTESLSLATIVMTVPVWNGPAERPY